MSIFTKAIQIKIPEQLVDTNSWLSDQEIIDNFFVNEQQKSH